MMRGPNVNTSSVEMHKFSMQPQWWTPSAEDRPGQDRTWDICSHDLIHWCTKLLFKTKHFFKLSHWNNCRFEVTLVHNLAALNDDTIISKVPKVTCLFYHLLDLLQHSSASCQCRVCQRPSLSSVFFLLSFPVIWWPARPHRVSLRQIAWYHFTDICYFSSKCK